MDPRRTKHCRRVPTGAVARAPQRDSSSDSNAVTSAVIHRAPFAPSRAYERPLRRLRWLLLISGLGFDSLAAHRSPIDEGLKFSLCESLPVNSRKSMALAIGQFSWQLQQWPYSISPPLPQCSRAAPRHAPSRASQPIPPPGTGLWHVREHAAPRCHRVRRCHRPRLTNVTALALVAIRIAARITKSGADLQGREIASKGEPQGHP